MPMQKKSALALTISKYHEIDKASEKKYECLAAERAALEKKRPDIKVLLFEPIAKAIMAKRPAFKRFSVLGPFGICCEYAIHFYRTKEETKKRDASVKGISFVLMPPRLRKPGEDARDELYVRDHRVNIKAVPEGSVGAVNGMNAQSILVPPDVTADWFIKYLS